MFVFSFLLTIVFFVANLLSKQDFCYWKISCFNTFSFIGVISMPFILVLFVSLINFKLKDLAFMSWKKFTFIYLLIYIFIIILVPSHSGDEYLDISRGLVGVILSCIYFLSSLILIVSKSLKKE
jgi:hypothetical protein